MNEKSPNRNWADEIMENNPYGDMPELNPICYIHNSKIWQNHYTEYFDQPNNNPADADHPLWFEWAMIGFRFN